ncbi:MAG: hypothetical protein Q9218_003274 [Villophora microphyllina]
MDPLSVSAAVAGLLIAGASVIDVLKNVKKMPDFAQGLMLVVNSITTCLGSLQSFLNGTVTARRSRTSLVMINDVRVVLTECVATFSKLRETLDRLGMNQQKRVVDRLKWASQEKWIANMMLRLQGTRVSLNLMLTTLTCPAIPYGKRFTWSNETNRTSLSIEEATQSSRDLRNLVLKALDNDEKLAQPFDDHPPHTAITPGNGASSVVTADNSDTIDTHLAHTTRGDDSQPIKEAPDLGFAFDQDLQATRVYRWLKYWASRLSLPSSTGRSRGWSFLSDVSLSEVSNVSVVSLPISAAELCDCLPHLLSFRPLPASPFTEELVTSGIDVREAAITWPPLRVASWWGPGLSMVERFPTKNKSGFDILFLQLKDMRSFAGRTNWERVQQLQRCITDDLLGRHGFGSLSGAAAVTDSDRPLPEVADAIRSLVRLSWLSPYSKVEDTIMTGNINRWI